MRVYLDNCCFNRPFDDQRQVRVRLETEAKLEVQQRIKDGRIELAWSYMLDFENLANPLEERRRAVSGWRSSANIDVEESPAVLSHARQIADRGVGAKDAIHIACAMAAGCGVFLTTDDVLVRKMRGFSAIAVAYPTQFILEVE
jgi:predicted nucleic acid-binding protein